MARAARVRRASVDTRPPRVASLRDVPGRLLRVDLLPLGLVRRRVGSHRAPVHGLGRAFPARHWGVVAAIAVGIGSQYLPRRLPLAIMARFSRLPIPAQAVVLSLALLVDSRDGARRRGTVHLLPVLMETRETPDPAPTPPHRGGRAPPALGRVGDRRLRSRALLVALLLNAPGLHKSATIQPEGWKRDVALGRDGTARERQRRVAASTGPARRSRRRSDGRTTTRSTPRSSRRDRSRSRRRRSHAGQPPKRVKFTPEKKLRLWIAGDSLVVVPGESVLREVAGNRAFDAVDAIDGRIASGLERPGCLQLVHARARGDGDAEAARRRPHVRRQRRPRVHDRASRKGARSARSAARRGAPNTGDASRR